MTVIPEGYAQITHVFSGLNCPTGAVVTYGLNVELVGNPQSQLEFIHASFGDKIVADNLTSDVTLDSTIMKYGPTETGPTFVVTDPIPGSSAINTSMAPNTAYLIVKNTPGGGRRNKGRLFLPGVFDGAADDSGTVAGATVTQLNDAWAAYYDDLDGGFVDPADPSPPVLLHAPSYTWTIVGGQPRRVYSDVAPPAPTLITSFTCSATLATQRNRLRR